MNLRLKSNILFLAGLVIVLVRYAAWFRGGPYSLDTLGHFLFWEFMGWSLIVMGSIAFVGSKILKKLDSKGKFTLEE